jgi:cobalt/nickel transport protein
MKRYQNWLLLIAVVLLAALPLWLVEKPAPDADGKAGRDFCRGR